MILYKREYKILKNQAFTIVFVGGTQDFENFRSQKSQVFFGSIQDLRATECYESRIFVMYLGGQTRNLV